MSSRYKGSGARSRQASFARSGPHWTALNAKIKPDTFTEKETVRIKKNGETAIVEEKTKYGYKLAGKKDYFPADALEKV